MSSVTVMDSAQPLIERLEAPFKLRWRDVSPNRRGPGSDDHGIAIWHAQDFQKRLWGAMWIWCYVLGNNPADCTFVLGSDSPAALQLEAIIRGTRCEHAFCQSWNRLHRRLRALEKLLSPEQSASMAVTRASRLRELYAELHTRFGNRDGTQIVQSVNPSESRPRAISGHAR